MLRRFLLLLSVIGVLMAAGSPSAGQKLSPAERRRQALEFHARAQERTGIIVPMYIYPANIHQNAVYNRLIDVKRRYETIPMWIIVNPASGPGKEVDANYTRAIDRLRGAGCVTLGYVATGYGKRNAAEVRDAIDRWLQMYPRIQGIFFDEMIYEDSEAGARYQSAVNQYAHDAGCWPTVANPGAETPGRYFAAGAADVIIVHELCNNIADNPTNPGQKDVLGAGLARVDSVASFPVRLSFWVFVQLSDQKKTGEARLAIMRADSGRRYFFRPITVRHKDLAQATVFCTRLYDCTFPERGVYFIELWYDDAWVVDQRLELT